MAEITVSDFNELRNAITDATSTIIHLDADITFSSGGITIPQTKGDILIDGGGHKVTDYASLAIGDTINFSTTAGPAVTVTLQNVVWSGRNLYGVIAVRNTANNSNITLMLNNVQYTGPQFVYNRYGTTRITDCTVNIEKNGSPSNPEEFCEANRLSIGGTVIVNSPQTVTSTNSVIWFPFSGSTFTVEENAVFKVTAPNTYMFYTDAAGRPVMTFKEGSTTEISTGDGLAYDAGADTHAADSFTLEKNATFKATHSNRRAVPTFKCRSSFVLEEGSTFHLTAPNSGTAALMYFRDRAAISFNNPKSVILYNNGGNVFNFATGTTASPNKINIDAELVNRWITATTPLSAAGGFSDPPTVAFSKKGYNGNVSATINATTSAISSITPNILPDDTGYPMSSTTFNIFQSQVLSMGNINIDLNKICDNSTAIKGMTEPLANLRVVYDSQTITGTAGPDGKIDLAIPKMPVDTDVEFAVNWNFLTKQITLTTIGSLTITHLPDLVFKCFAVPYQKDIVNRTDPDWYMEVTDTRKDGGPWYLYASLPTPMSTVSGATLDDTLTINEETSSTTITNVPVLIKQGSSPPIVTTITWSEVEGFLLKVDPVYLYDGGRYTGTIEWDLRATPLP